MYQMIRLFNTIKYLKFKQICFRLYYIIRKRLRDIQRFEYPLSLVSHSNPLSLNHSLQFVVTNKSNEFIFLNLSHKFDDGINWNFSNFGKLWTYNLTYFEYLNQKDMSQDKGLTYINDFIDQAKFIKDGLEPFPISLRGINWIKYITSHKLNDKKINDSLYAQYKILMDNIEYHLLGNHLLENGFSLLFGAYYFQSTSFYMKAKEILTEELEEQVLDDGAHFELSPMYHQIMLFRLLDCINLVQNNSWKEQELLPLLQEKAKIMLGWITIMTFKNGDIPLLNDSANGIAPKTKSLLMYGDRLGIEVMKKSLGECGYRKFSNERYECIVDVGNIGPDYIPGHAHSDTFNFELYIGEKPFIVDTGISTYETNTRRTLERSTASHNTVEIDGIDQSEVWGGFRVANRAYVVDIDETDDFVRSTHYGYKKRLDALHQRAFLFEAKKIKIIDTIISEKKHNAIARLHFYPVIEPIIIEGGVQIDDINIKIQGSNFKINDYNYAPEFNKLKKAKVLEIPFTKKLEIEIIL